MKSSKFFLKSFITLTIFLVLMSPNILLAEWGEGESEVIDPWAGEDAPSSTSDALNKLKTVGGGAYGTGEAEPKGPVEIVGEVIKIGLNIIGLVFLGLMLYGGYLWMTGGGDEQRITKAKSTIEAAVIGLVIVFAAYGITYFVVNQITEKVL